jgi:hypothetical protein
MVTPVTDVQWPAIEIFPDQSDELPQFIIVEARRGTAPIRDANALWTNEVHNLAPQVGGGINDITHIGGSTNPKTGEEVPELYLKPKKDLLNAAGINTEGRRGGSYLDIAFRHEITGRRLFINTVDVRADKVTPSTREQNAAVRIILNAENGDILVLVPKPREGETFDRKAVEKFLRPFLEELGRPKPKVDPRNSKVPQELWHRFLPPSQ